MQVHTRNWIWAMNFRPITMIRRRLSETLRKTKNLRSNSVRIMSLKWRNKYRAGKWTIEWNFIWSKRIKWWHSCGKKKLNFVRMSSRVFWLTMKSEKLPMTWSKNSTTIRSWRISLDATLALKFWNFYQGPSRRSNSSKNFLKIQYFPSKFEAKTANTVTTRTNFAPKARVPKSLMTICRSMITGKMKINSWKWRKPNISCSEVQIRVKIWWRILRLWMHRIWGNLWSVAC